MKKYILLLAAVAVLIGAVFVAAAPHTFADTSADICHGLQLTGQQNCNDTTTLTSIVKRVISIMSVIVGITAVIFVLVGGFKFITSSGDSQKAASARNTIIYAVVGLVVAALAQVIVSYVLTNVK
jgi:uncharacterized membrane protein